jgi:hypothetical protein
MDFGGRDALPNVLFPIGGRAIPALAVEALRAFPYNDPGLRMFAEYNVQDITFWIQLRNAFQPLTHADCDEGRSGSNIAR